MTVFALTNNDKTCILHICCACTFRKPYLSRQCTELSGTFLIPPTSERRRCHQRPRSWLSAPLSLFRCSAVMPASAAVVLQSKAPAGRIVFFNSGEVKTCHFLLCRIVCSLSLYSMHIKRLKLCLCVFLVHMLRLNKWKQECYLSFLNFQKRITT